MALRGSAVFSSIGKLYRIFNQRQKRAFHWLLVLTFISSFTDIVGLASIIPIVALVLTPEYYVTLTHYVPFLAHMNKQHTLLLLVGIFFLLIVGKNAFGLYINRLQVRFTQNLFVTSSMNVLNKVYDRSLLDIQKETSNELVNKLTYLQISLCSNAAIPTIIVINEGIVFAITAITLCLWNWQLFLLMIGVMIPIMGGFYGRVKGMIKTAGIERSNNMVKLFAGAQEMIFGYTDIKIAGTEKNFKNKFEKYIRQFNRHQGKIDFMQFIPTRIIEIAIFLCVILILLYGVYVIKDMKTIVATISLFSVFAYRSIPSVNRFVMAMSNLTSTEFILNDPDFQQEEMAEEKHKEHSLSFNDKIVFNNVSYRYSEDSKYVIKDCNLTIKKGEKIGIIGKSGAGKSTLIGNILGFLSPSKGEIRIDNTLLNDETIIDWWKIVGYVRQEVFIMNTTFIENIALGEQLENIKVERVQHAIKLASLTELVADMPDGLYTMLNERGNNLSGGQKQRIAIARAIYKGAEVLIFDEATSALDSKTEQEITNSIQQLGHEDLTIIIIAHRYTSLKYCNKIYSLENGHIGDSFTYNELATNANT
ncbi:MAG TPA: ATP-binding cassette domain-containing protein [Flavipsychrobacter sp.]|nr:ATP-binding cassette domain-containing protein [Flavipsychrobacter sp.]